MYKKRSFLKTLAVLLISTLIVLTNLTACNNDGGKSKEIKKKYNPSKSLKLGDNKKVGYLINFETESFAENDILSLKVLMDEEVEEFINQDFEFIGNPISVNYGDQENVRLQVPALMTVKLPKDETELSEYFFANYYDGQWEYLMPDYIDLKDKTASIEVSHFSFWGFGKLSEDEQIKNFAHNLATIQFQRTKIKENLHKSLGRQYEDLFESMGVTNGNLREKLTMDMIDYFESEIYEPNSDLSVYTPMSTLVTMANAVGKGKDGRVEMQDAMLEFIGKGIFQIIQKDPSQFSMIAGVTGGLSRAAGAMMEGDTKAALEGVADALRTNFIVRVADDLTTLVKETGEYAVEIWTMNELEKAYKAYIGEGQGKYGYHSDVEGDFDTIFITLGGGATHMELNIVKKYCAKYNLKYEDLTQEKRTEILNNAYKYLEESFKERKASESEIKRLETRQILIINEMKKLGMLNETYNPKYFGMDKKGAKFSIDDRLKRLYAIRDKIISLIDEDQRDKVSEEFIARAMDHWIFLNSVKKQDDFFKYMREMGYIKEPYKVDPSYIWVHTNTIYLEAPDAVGRTSKMSDGSASFTTTHEQSGDVFTASTTWTRPNKKYRADETVTLSLSASIDDYQWYNTEDPYFHVGLNYMNASVAAWIDDADVAFGYRGRGAIRLLDKDDRHSANVGTDYGKIVRGSDAGDYSAKFPAGSTEGKKIGIHVTNSSVGKYVYIYEWRQE